MALCHNCDDTRIEYIGNGSQTDYTFPFEYNQREDVEVAEWDEELYHWEVTTSPYVFLNDTTLRFDTAPADGQKFIIYRCTDLTPLPAQFYPGTAIKAQDLNDNFFVIVNAIEEAKCATKRLSDKADEKFWNKISIDHPEGGETIYSTDRWQCTDEAVATTQAICDKIEEELDRDKITLKENQTGRWVDGDLNDDDHLATGAAITDRLDPFFQEALPPDPNAWRLSGKAWFNNDTMQYRVWDDINKTWINIR